MVTTIWEVKRGMVTSVKYENENVCRILTLRTPVHSDQNNIFKELDNAVEVVNRLVVSSVSCREKKDVSIGTGNVENNK